jgi:arylamine N-acetyltransferase
VGFGNNVPTSPLPLEENTIATNIAPTEMRLVKESLPEAVDQTQKFWIYQIRFNPESRWVPLYAFFEAEFLPQDFATFNYQTYKSPSSWFTQMVVSVKHFLNETGDEVQGLYIMGGKKVKKRTFGKTEVVQTLANEEDRVEALSTWFGINLLEHEVEGIKGMGSELK